MNLWKRFRQDQNQIDEEYQNGDIDEDEWYYRHSEAEYDFNHGYNHRTPSY